MMNRWSFLVVLVVIALVITSFILLSAVDFGTADTNKTYDGHKPNGFKVAMGMLIAAFVLPIAGFLIYLLNNGMFSFAMCR